MVTNKNRMVTQSLQGQLEHTTMQQNDEEIVVVQNYSL
jgi:hypothetical protein